VVLDFDGDLESWPRDARVIQGAEMRGEQVRVDLSYGGGCSVHHFNLVVGGGWMESNPVQVNAIVSHDAHNDNCDALLFRTVHFDLRPLKRAYQDAYGVGTPGSTTLVINLLGGGTYSSSQSLLLRYVF
jgi:hypothetical protein